jgi:hypothetical protein
MTGKKDIDHTDMAPEAEDKDALKPIDRAQKDAAQEREEEGGYNG